MGTPPSAQLGFAKIRLVIYASIVGQNGQARSTIKFTIVNIGASVCELCNVINSFFFFFLKREGSLLNTETFRKEYNNVLLMNEIILLKLFCE